MQRPGISAALAAGALVLATLPALSAPALASPQDGGDPLDQTVERDEEIGDEQVVIESGHVDVGPRIIDGEWQLLARDDSTAPPVWRELEDLVFHMGDVSILPAPEDEQFSFISAEPGEDVYVIPQTEDYEVPWLGWNSQDPEVVDQLARGMTLRLHGVDGPGQFTAFLQSGNFDDAQLLWTSDDPAPQDIWADTNTHVHANWVFTEPGIYLLDVEVVGDLADGTTASDRDVLRFAVGDETDPREAFDAEYTAPAEAEEGAADADAGAADTGTADGAGEDSAAIPALALGIGAAVILLGVIVGVSVLRSRRAREAASRPSSSEAGDA